MELAKSGKIVEPTILIISLIIPTSVMNAVGVAINELYLTGLFFSLVLRI
jgi:hypothetical protein